MPTPRTDDPWIPPDPVSLDSIADPVEVLRLTVDGDGEKTYQLLDNVRVLQVVNRAGTYPGTATFAYIFNELASGQPVSFEQALDTSSTSPKTVEPGDRLVVRVTRWDGEKVLFFDGNVLDFAFGVDEEDEGVQLKAIGIAKRLWDQPIEGMVMRDGWKPEEQVDVRTDLPAQFNPKGVPNCSPSGADTDEGDVLKSYPVFMDPLIIREPDVRRLWTLPLAARYLCWWHNLGEEFVKNPSRYEIEETLYSRKPIPGIPYDPDDNLTYTKEAIVCSDKPITGRDWPTVLHEIIRDKGFGMRMDLESDSSGFPITQMRVFRWRSGPIKPLWLQPWGSPLADPARSNLSAARMDRDLSQVVNAWVVEGAPIRYEVSFILVPGFRMSSIDLTDPTYQNFDKGNPDQPDRSLYRIYVLDETGEGAWLPGRLLRIEDPPVSFDPIFGVGDWVRRRRKPIGTLFTQSIPGKREKARLEYSQDYTGAKPGIWTGGGTWTAISSGWNSLPDRIGIEITEKNPNRWEAGNYVPVGGPRVIRGIEWQQVTREADNFVLRYTCVVEADKNVRGDSDISSQSPLPYKIVRRIDASDRIKKYIISKYSVFNTTGSDIVVRDDADSAQAEALANREASEAGILEGEVVLPHLTDYYRIGDRVGGINGRGLSFNTGLQGGAIYPVVESIRWNFDDEQSTTISLSDESQERHRIERKIRR